MNPPNYGCAFVHSILPNTALKQVDDANPNSREQFCSMIEAKCAERHSSKDAISQCLMISSTGKFQNNLIHRASSLEDVEKACCTRHPESDCFQPPDGKMSSCSEEAFMQDKDKTFDKGPKNISHYGNRTGSSTAQSAPSDNEEEASTSCSMECFEFQNANWKDLNSSCRDKLLLCNKAQTAMVSQERKAEKDILRSAMEGESVFPQ